LRTCFATWSSSFRVLHYADTVEEVGALARYFTGWSRSDLMSMPVRERRYRLKWATAIVSKQNREAATKAAAPQVTFMGR
jgi:hypothetical protein